MRFNYCVVISCERGRCVHHSEGNPPHTRRTIAIMYTLDDVLQRRGGGGGGAPAARRRRRRRSGNVVLMCRRYQINPKVASTSNFGVQRCVAQPECPPLNFLTFRVFVCVCVMFVLEFAVGQRRNH